MCEASPLGSWWSHRIKVPNTDTTENYSQSYNITLKNNGSEDIDLSEGLYHFYAIYRDDEGNVTGVSDVDVEGFDADNYPVFAVGDDVTKTAEVYDVYPGTCQIVITWLGVMTQ